jgi:uncharacterized protein (TIGR00297 family)
MTARSEYARQFVHMAMGGFAFALRYLTWWQAALLAGSALAFNLFVLPHVGGQRLYRSWEFARGFPAGILLYPISVLLLILVFPRRPDIAAAAWAILAVGDGMSTIVGRAVGGRPIPWNREKTWAGSAAFFVFGSVAGVALAWWCRAAVHPAPSMWFWIAAPIAAALCAAAAESIPIRLDDNVSVPIAAAAVLWLASLMSEDAARASIGTILTRLPAAVGLNAMVALAGYRAKTVSLSGAVCGAIIGSVIFTATGWRGWTLLLATFLSAAITSRLGLRRKTLLGIAEERGGRRRAANAIANTGVAAAAALVALLSPSASAALIAFAAALTAGGSDTVASEIGKAWGRHAYLVPTFRHVPPGTSGAVSVEGTAAGLIGAFVLASLAAALQLIPTAALVPVALAATIGAFVESTLGATLEAPGIVNNDVLNFLNTAVAAMLAAWFAGWLT